MQLNLAAVLALGASDDYEIIAALSGNSAALALCVSEWLHDTDNWIGASYILTSGEKDTIDSLIGTLVCELMTAYENGNGNGVAGWAHFRDEKVKNTQGGTFTSGDWRLRDLQTERYDPDEIVSIVDNQFRPIEGNYIIVALCPANKVEWHQARLYNDTGAAVVRLGTSAQARNGYGQQTHSVIIAGFAANGTDWYELQHRCTFSNPGDGFGYPSNIDVETYTDVLLIGID